MCLACVCKESPQIIYLASPPHLNIGTVLIDGVDTLIGDLLTESEVDGFKMLALTSNCYQALVTH